MSDRMIPVYTKNNQYDINGVYLFPETDTKYEVHRFERLEDFLYEYCKTLDIKKQNWDLFVYIIRNQRKDGTFNILEHFKPMTELCGCMMGTLRKKISMLAAHKKYNHRILLKHGHRDSFEYKINPYFNFPKKKGKLIIEYTYEDSHI